MCTIYAIQQKQGIVAMLDGTNLPVHQIYVFSILYRLSQTMMTRLGRLQFMCIYIIRMIFLFFSEIQNKVGKIVFSIEITLGARILASFSIVIRLLLQ